MRVAPGQVKPALWKGRRKCQLRKRRRPANLWRLGIKSVHRRKRLKPPDLPERHLNSWRVCRIVRLLEKKNLKMNQVKEMKVREFMQNRAKSSEKDRE